MPKFYMLIAEKNIFPESPPVLPVTYAYGYC